MSDDLTGQPFTVVVRQVVKPGREAEFETAMKEFIAESLGFPGSGDFHVVRPSGPGSTEYTVIHRFADEAARRRFVDAPTYRPWMARLRALTDVAPRMQEFGGIAGWFTLPGPGGRSAHGPPPRWKMALVTFVGVYPLTSVLPGFFVGLLPGRNPLAVNIVVTGTIVVLLTWAVMPLLTRVFARWLFHPTNSTKEIPS